LQKASLLTSKKRIIAFIDGFNLYHAIDDLHQNHLKWLDLWALSEAFIKSSTERIEAVYYFTALATWRPDCMQRHKTYIRALETRNVTTILGHFKKKKAYCNSCKTSWDTREEKESDVNIAIYLLNEAHLDHYDKAFIVTADSDLVPAIQMVLDTFPEKEIVVLTPPNRYRIAREIRSKVETIKIREKHLKNNLLPETLNVDNGAVSIRRPEKYAPQSK
jgi:uncharacterized LabA/DUF88 family protein